jgi:hypothetical protein
MEQIINPSKTIALENLLNVSTKHLSETIDVFNDTNFNQVPFEGSWTAAQVSEHVLKSLDRINQMVLAPTRYTTRNPEQFVIALREMMENFSMKAKSASNLLPGSDPVTKTDIQNRLQQRRDGLFCSIRDLDLSETCIGFEFPGIGHLTRFELISFGDFNMLRHIQQIKNIHKTVGNIQ